MPDDVQRLLAAFIEEDRGATPADPRRYLDQMQGLDRDELTELIDAYLQRAPRRSVPTERLNAEQPGALGARGAADRIERSLFGESGEWPVLLPRLRERARVSRRDLVAALADRLGVGGDRERVAVYYHRMEHGRLEADGVSDRVLEALSVLLGSTVERLREAGRAVAPIARPADAPAYARTAAPDEELAAGVRPDSASAAQPDAGRAPDLVDELFNGGRGGGGTAG